MNIDGFIEAVTFIASWVSGFSRNHILLALFSFTICDINMIIMIKGFDANDMEQLKIMRF